MRVRHGSGSRRERPETRVKRHRRTARSAHAVFPPSGFPPSVRKPAGLLAASRQRDAAFEWHQRFFQARVRLPCVRPAPSSALSDSSMKWFRFSSLSSRFSGWLHKATAGGAGRKPEGPSAPGHAVNSAAMRFLVSTAFAGMGWCAAPVIWAALLPAFGAAIRLVDPYYDYRDEVGCGDTTMTTAKDISLDRNETEVLAMPRAEKDLRGAESIDARGTGTSDRQVTNHGFPGTAWCASGSGCGFAAAAAPSKRHFRGFSPETRDTRYMPTRIRAVTRR